MFNGGQKTGNTGDIFIAQPDEHKESLAGRLFIMMEVESQKSQALKVANFLINSINYNYYQNEKILLREQMKSLKVEHIFETALANVNKDLVDFLRQEKIKISPYSINLTVGVIYENTLHISSLGKNKNLLIYPVKEDGPESYKVADIEKGQERTSKTLSFTKFFSDVISGPLPENSYYFLANETLREHLSEKQIIETITKLPPIGAATHIENTVQQTKLPVNFMGVIIKNTTNTEEKSEEEDRKEASQLFDINRAREETENILKPSGIINLKDIAKKSTQILTKKEGGENTKDQEGSEDRTSSKDQLKRTFVTQSQKTSKVLSKLLGKSKKFTKNFFQGIVSVIKREDNVFIKSGNNNDWGVRNFSKKNKYILAGVFIFLVAFLISTSFDITGQKRAELEQEMNKLIQDIEKNQNLVEANLLYDNKNRAESLMEEARSMLSDMEAGLQEFPDDQEKQEQYQEFIRVLKDQEREIRNILAWQEAEKIADLNDFSQEPKSNNIILSQGSIYILDKSESSVYQVNLEDEQVNILEDPMLAEVEEKYVTQTGDNIYYVTNQGAIQLDPEDGDLSEVELDMPSGLDIGGIGGFNNNLYILDKNSGQIHNYANLQSRQDWLSDPESQDLSGISDMFIDGYIYTLDSQGNVKQYLRGDLEDFSISDIDPEWQEASRIKTSPDMGEGFIYILDSSKNRIGIFTKQGSFIHQYQEEEVFSDIKDFYIDEETDTIYILNENSLYSHPLER